MITTRIPIITVYLADLHKNRLAVVLYYDYVKSLVFSFTSQIDISMKDIVRDNSHTIVQNE